MEQLLLIQEIKKHPLLYDTNNSEYNKTKLKEKVWKDIAQSLNYAGGNKIS